MASAHLIGPYRHGGALGPGQEHLWAIGPFAASFTGTMHVMAHAYNGPGSQYTQAMAITFTQLVVAPLGDHYINFRVQNSGSTIVSAYSVYLTTIEP